MRLFTAIDVPDPILIRLERLISALRHEAHINWSPIDNLHITLKFIGQWPEERLEELSECLGSLSHRVPFPIELKSLGWFPNERSPRVLFAGVEAGTSLRDLVRNIEERLAPLGIAPETREYSPHLTLARIKHPVPLARLRQRVADLASTQLGAFQAESFALFRSDPGSNASVYRKLTEYRLEAALAAS